MSAEVICLSSSSSSSSSSSDEDVSLSVVSAVASSNKSAAVVAAAVAHGGEKTTQKRHLSPASIAAHSVNAADGPSSSKRPVENIPAPRPQPGCSYKTAVGDGAAAARVSSGRVEKKVVKPQLVVVTKVPIPTKDEDVFQNFVQACLMRRDDKDTKQVLAKLEKLHSKLSSIQKQDSEFRLLINNCHNMISNGLAKDIYTPILELHTEIKRLIKAAAVVKLEQQQQQDEEDDQEIEEQERQLSKGDVQKIKLLEGSIQKCLKKIKKLEEKEVDFDDDDNSAYIQEERYKKRLIQLYNALSKVSGDKILKKQLLKKKIKRSDIAGEMTGIPLVDEAILNLVNSDISKINQFKHLKSTVRLANHIKMPDYMDVLKCIEKCNKDSNLDLHKIKMEKLAKRAFSTVGNFLKKKRTDETKHYFQSFLPLDDGDDDDKCQDPAIKDGKLNKKLCENKKEGDNNLKKIFEKYVNIQEGLSEKDMEEQQQVSSDQETDSYSSSESDISELTKQQDGTKNLVEPSTLKSKISSSGDDNDNGGSAQIFKCRTTVDGNDNDTSDMCDEPTARDPLDTSITSLPVETEKLSASNKIIVNNAVQKISLPVFHQAASAKPSTPTTAANRQQLETAPQRSVSPPPAAAAAIVAAAAHPASKEDTGECCCPTNKRPVIKVCAFAKPPPAWGGLSDPSSPEKEKSSKPRQANSSFTRRPPRPTPPPLECIDLTKEKEEKQLTISSRLPSIAAPPPPPRTRNPLANVKRTMSSPQATTAAAAAAASSSLPRGAKRVVIVKNVINNFHVPLSDAAAAAAASSRGKNIFHSSRSSSSSSSSTTFNRNKHKSHSRDTVWLSKDMKRP